MRKISLTIQVPDWARWLSTDKYGVVECWANQPMTDDINEPGRWMYGGKRKELLQYDSQACRSWRKTLRKI